MRTLTVNFVEERAIQLAIVFVTRNPSLSVLEPATGSEYDLLVHIEGNRQTDRAFGVEVKGLLSSQKLPKASVRATNAPTDAPWQKADIPVYQFLFLADTDKGSYRPASNIGTADSQEENGYKELDADALDTIIAQVNRWYDFALQAS